MSTSTFQRLYDSEINFEVSCFYDADLDVRLGDALNGFLAQDKVPTWEAVEKWLHYAALKYYPNSAYARHALGDAWRPTDDQVMPNTSSPSRSVAAPVIATPLRVPSVRQAPRPAIAKNPSS